jgi:DNA-binding NarL/FixJ family response regulator
MNILLIDGHRLFSEGLKNVLIDLPEIDKVYITNELCYKIEPYLASIDLVICDMNEPRMTGFDIINTVRTGFKENIPIMVLSGHTDLHTIKQSIRLGANAFISKSTDLAELIEAIYAVRAGKRFISKSLRVNLLNSLYTEETMGYQLSGREREVLHELCSGRTVKAIASEMGLSTHTIQYYQRNLMRKLKVSRTVDLVMYAVRNGLYTATSSN